MRLTKKLLTVFAPLLLVAACNDLGSSSANLSGEHGSAAAGDCTLTQGYWKNHASAWPVDSLTLGTRTYTKAELIEILKTPVKGNGLLSLAHQLIAAKLNVAAGADDAAIAASITAADNLIGSRVVGEDSLQPSATSNLVGKLDAFNSGDIGPGHCGEGDSCDANGGDCDGEVDESGGPDAGIGSDCDAPELPICGNGVIETGEDCDDGNLVNGDGCSAACVCECPSH